MLLALCVSDSEILSDFENFDFEKFLHGPIIHCYCQILQTVYFHLCSCLTSHCTRTIL